MACVAAGLGPALPLVLGEPAARALSGQTYLVVGGLRQTYAPIEPLAIPGAANLSAAFVDRCNVLSEKSAPYWERAAARALSNASLHIAVLGTSPTSGCGAAELERPAIFENNHTKELSRLCEPRRSWGRHLRDFLVRLLGPSAPHVSISSKNAVGAAWFTRCTSSFIPGNTDVVLLEVLTNVFGSDLQRLLQYVRRAAPRAVIAFVMWPPFGSIHRRNADHQSMFEAARIEGADAIEIRRVLLELHILSGGAVFYAQQGRDHVHPNPFSHQLIGALAARYVANQLLERMECVRRANLQNMRAALQSRQSAVLTGEMEVCYNSAELMPINESTGTFKLIDEGGDKGVRKMGYVSHRIGDSLRLGPLPHPVNRNCTMVAVTLGYLLSGVLKNQGAFLLSCKNCECISIHAPYQNELYPFPRVESDSAVASWSTFRDTNMSITATTEFWTILEKGRDCFVELVHLQSARTTPLVGSQMAISRNASRIRIDSLSVWLNLRAFTLGTYLYRAN